LRSTKQYSAHQSFSDDESTLWSDFAGSAARTIPVGGSDGALVVVIVSGG
jgi:hypothetical protein